MFQHGLVLKPKLHFIKVDFNKGHRYKWQDKWTVFFRLVPILASTQGVEFRTGSCNLADFTTIFPSIGDLVNDGRVPLSSCVPLALFWGISPGILDMTAELVLELFSRQTHEPTNRERSLLTCFISEIFRHITSPNHRARVSSAKHRIYMIRWLYNYNNFSFLNILSLSP